MLWGITEGEGRGGGTRKEEEENRGGERERGREKYQGRWEGGKYQGIRNRKQTASHPCGHLS